MATVSSLSISDHAATAGRAFAVVMASRNGAKDAFFTVSLSSAVLFTGIWPHLAISSSANGLVINCMNFHAASLCSLAEKIEKLIADGKLNDKLAKQTVAGVLAGEGTPSEVVEKRGLKVVSDDGLIDKAVDEAFAANPDVVEKLKSGNMKPMGVIIGAVMRATRGQADAKAVTKVVMSKIK